MHYYSLGGWLAAALGVALAALGIAVAAVPDLARAAAALLDAWADAIEYFGSTWPVYLAEKRAAAERRRKENRWTNRALVAIE